MNLYTKPEVNFIALTPEDVVSVSIIDDFKRDIFGENDTPLIIPGE